MIAAENWCVKVADKVYGPYSTQQLRKFAHEGRLAAWSLISPAGGREWREARTETVLANFFGYEPASKGKFAARTFGKREEQFFETPTEETANGKARTPATQASPRIANFIIIFDVVSAAATRVEAAILSLGTAFRVADNVWSLSCELTAVGVRNAIAPYLSGSESIFVIDATRGRTSWQNYAPETHAKISSAYLTAKYQ